MRYLSVFAVAAAACFATGSAFAWDVRTKAIFKNDSDVTITADMHGEMPNATVNPNQTWEHISYYSGDAGRGYNLSAKAGDKYCRVSVLVRSVYLGVPGFYTMHCDNNPNLPDENRGLNCGLVKEGFGNNDRMCQFTVTVTD